MKVTFLTRSLDYGGAERQAALLACGLKARGHDISIMTFYGGGPFQRQLSEAGVRLVDLHKQGRWDLAGFLLRLAANLRREQPDVVYSYLPVANLLATLAKPLAGVSRVVWGVRASAFDLSDYDWLTRRSYALERRFAAFPDLIVVNSEAGLKHLRAKGFPQEKTVAIPNGVDVQTFRPRPDGRRRVRAEWGISENQRLVGSVGRLDPLKDHRTFLRAASLLGPKNSDLRFVCVGDGPPDYRAGLQEFARELGLGRRLIWVTKRDDMPDVYSAFDVHCLSSISEGFPNVLAEAMACGVPCVATNVGDSMAIVGDTGTVVPPGEPEAMAQAWLSTLDRLAGDPSLGSKAREHIADNFSEETMIQRSAETLSRIIG